MAVSSRIFRHAVIYRLHDFTTAFFFFFFAPLFSYFSCSKHSRRCFPQHSTYKRPTYFASLWLFYHTLYDLNNFFPTWGFFVSLWI
ncbi:hypothetical protein QBC42DRAFT_15119 [Cladorrhinum samala]|uniref:Uncharacterized protein n=1 Tax=Cladorrhinum samala TaxID=585594 RepID=A0AAV9HFN6_9PEZI|nr:hypothetical protein QBC42DRAFT_15119 [Cladorrhinum samala]